MSPQRRLQIVSTRKALFPQNKGARFLQVFSGSCTVFGGPTISNKLQYVSLRHQLECDTGAALAQLSACFKDPEHAARSPSIPHGSRGEYGEFLLCQYAARAPVENWVREQCPFDLRPPLQLNLLKQDLADLSLSAQITAIDLVMHEMSWPVFAIPGDTDPLGLVWALARISLESHNTLAHLKSSADGADWPTRFLKDTRMIDFWQDLQPRLSEPTTAGQARMVAQAANDLITHFTLTVRTVQASYPALPSELAA